MSERIELKKADPKSMIDSFELHAIYSENIQYTKEKKIPKVIDHLKWWFKVFETEDLYLIRSLSFVIGYVRISKETKEINIALKKEWQNMTIGSQALKLLKEKPLLARVHKSNKRSLHFFAKHSIPVEVIE